MAAARSKNPRRPVGMEDLPDAAPATTNTLFDYKNRKNKRRCGGGWGAREKGRT